MAGHEIVPRGSTARRMVDLDDGLIASVQARYKTGDGQLPVIRETIARAVRDHLPLVVQRLVAAGLTARPTGRRRPRNLENCTWELLKQAEAAIALSQIELARCCLVLAARGEAAPEDSADQPHLGLTGGKL